MTVDIKIKIILWRLIKKIVMNREGPSISIAEWIDEAIREKILREPTFYKTPDKNKK